MSGPVRIQRKRTKGWRMPANTVYVGRPGKFGNPFDFSRSEFCWAALSFGCRGDAAGRREASIRAFRDWIAPGHGRRTLSSEEQPKMVCAKGEVPLGPKITAGEAPSVEIIKAELRGKNLACWCALVDKDGNPVPCHADVLLELANK